MAIPLCCTWPSKTSAQKNLVKFLLNLNFFYYPTGEEENFFMDEEETIPILSGGTTNYSTNKDVSEFGIDHFSTLSAAKRRRQVDQFLGSLCTYFFIATFGLMLVFVSVFMAHGYNDSVTITLETVDESAISDSKLAKYGLLSKLDSSPFMINISLVGYNGQCTLDDVYIFVSGCHSLDYRTLCSYSYGVNAPSHDQTQCSVQVNFQASALDQTATFTVGFSKLDFYAQQAKYNVSTTNNNKTQFQGNSYIIGALQPAEGNILRGNATLELMSILTYMGNCKSTGPGEYFSADLVRVNEEQCTPNSTSFKSLSYLSTTMTAADAGWYNNLNVSGFAVNVALVKGPFFRYVQQSYYVSFGTILTIFMFAALDVYWLVEASVPWLGYLIWKIQTGILRLLHKL